MPLENTQTDRERLARVEVLLKHQTDAIVELRAYLAQVLAELKRNDETQQTAIQQRALFCAQQTGQQSQALNDITELKQWRKEVEKLVPAIRAVIWIGGILGVSVLALIWALITGQAQLMFP